MIETQRAQRTARRARSKVGRNWLKALYAEWRKLSPGLASDLPERDLRLQWTNDKLGRHKLGFASKEPVIASWAQLTDGEARRLLKAMKDESGSAADYRGMLIAKLAQELFGAEWDRMLAERLNLRFQIKDLRALTAAQAHAEIEELMSRIARRDGAEIEEVRARFAASRQKAVGSRQRGAAT